MSRSSTASPSSSPEWSGPSRRQSLKVWTPATAPALKWPRVQTMPRSWLCTAASRASRIPHRRGASYSLRRCESTPLFKIFS
ncbi:hypothetical protein ACFPRL_33125 [Pseudoclavibacter helvolus]